ncbi:hypothetical protein [Kribbella sindirgiensis]|uniref:Uncharacterized protein n=1 Tax=Kribbella sindirgiensis TaxID=1124744 RepID=A0A4R0I246_9ACTN|nr:hypothetical protein [Kribbella sindirgiensis]TCC19946.1 hypothetical protein E0H50_37585 [Kribbella sindirgiensis]
MSEATIVTASAADAGCWFEGSRGHYAITAMIQRAKDHGMTFEDASLAAVDAFNAGELTMTAEDGLVTIDLLDEIHELADAAEDWLNEYVAPDTHLFGWHEGEFFLMPREWWQEVGE